MRPLSKKYKDIKFNKLHRQAPSKKWCLLFYIDTITENADYPGFPCFYVIVLLKGLFGRNGFVQGRQTIT
jgi:hypothetical protein